MPPLATFLTNRYRRPAAISVLLTAILSPVPWSAVSGQTSEPASAQATSKSAAKLKEIERLFKQRQSTQAVKLSEELSAQNPKDANLHESLGILLASHDQNRAAQIEFEKANSLQPETFEFLFNLGASYVRTGDLKKLSSSSSARKPSSPIRRRRCTCSLRYIRSNLGQWTPSNFSSAPTSSRRRTPTSFFFWRASA